MSREAVGSPEALNVARAWLIQTTEIPPFIYDPLVHSREYVLAYLEQAGASEAEVANVLRQVEALEERARRLVEAEE
ncbi:MAG TPA: hypothetical protein VKZ60_09580 [Chloroflexota bacterium]|jgi:hypothetical protein|nr:hypothetical protein [Chloroflexota bacterium]